MRCDDPGGLCAADQPQRSGSEQMREKEGDTRQKGEEWKGSASERTAVSSSSSQAARRLLQTGSDYSLPGCDGRNGAVQHSTLCAAHPQRAGYRGDICITDEAAHREREGYALVLLHEKVDPYNNTPSMHPTHGLHHYFCSFFA